MVKSNEGAQFFIGTSGYSYPDWKGIVYPRCRAALKSENFAALFSAFYRLLIHQQL
jgi:uncharacterized protein YecE (DUF72 family)